MNVYIISARYVCVYVCAKMGNGEDKKQGQDRRDRYEGKSRGKEERKGECMSVTVMEKNRSK